MASESHYAPVPLHEGLPAANIPLPPSTTSLVEPRPAFLESSINSPRDSYAPSSIAGSARILPVNRESAYLNGQDESLNEKTNPSTTYGAMKPSPKRRRCSPLIAIISLIALAVVVLAVILPVFFLVIKPRENKHSSSASATQPNHGTGSSGNGDGNSDGTPTKTNQLISGGDGSTIKLSDGSSFVYNNSFGGICE